MAAIDSLVYSTTIDPKGWGKGLDTGLKAFDAFDKQINAQLGKIKMPDMEMSGGGGTESLAAIFPLLKSQLSGAFSGIGEQFARMAGSMTEPLSVISKQMKKAFSFEVTKDGIQSTSNIYHQMIARAERDIRDMERANIDPLRIRKTAQDLRKFDDEFKLHLQHSQASFAKGGSRPIIDTLFSPDMKAFLGGKGGNAAAASMGTITAATNRATGSLKSFGQQALVALGVFGLAFKAVDFFKGGIKGAADLAETLSKTNAILGDATPAVTKFADEMASKFGLVKGTTLDVAASFAGLGKGLGGLEGGALSDFSTKFAKLAADVSSYANVDFKEAAKALSTGLAGNQSDVLKGLGVIVSDAAIKQYALAHNMKLVGGELTENAKLMARAALITKGLDDASGDLDKTQASVANMTRKFWGQIDNLAASIGTRLLPAVSMGLEILTEFGAFAQTSFDAADSAFVSFANSVKENFAIVGTLFRNWQSVLTIAQLRVGEFASNAVAYIEAFAANFMTIGTYLVNNWTKLFVDMAKAVMKIFQNLGKNVGAFAAAIFAYLKDPTQGFKFEWTGLLEGFEATADKLPDLIKPKLIDVSEAIQAEMDKIQENEARRIDGKALTNATRKPILPKAEGLGKSGDLQIAAAVSVGSIEGRSAALHAIQGSRQGSAERNAQATALNTGRLVGLMERQLRQQENRPAPSIVKF